VRVSDKEMAPQVLAHPGTRPTETKGRTVDERILAQPRTRLRPEKPKLADCSSCDGKYPHRELIELHEDNHDNLTFFNGERLCKPCACRDGIAY
jgi:hypothetical protein